MAQLVAAFGSSHSVMLPATLEDWLTRFREADRRLPFYDREGRRITFDDVLARAPSNAADFVTPAAITARFHEVQRAMERLKVEIAAARLDALIIVGDDQYELFHDQVMPAISIYYGDTIRNAARKPVAAGDWYKQAQMRRYEDNGDVHYPCHRALALHLIEGFTEREFDITALASLADDQQEGHAYSFVHRWYLQEKCVPIVPVFMNTYNPPNPPTPRRCARFGTALRALIAAYPEDMRVGILASGGLSHFVVEEEMDRAILKALERKDIEYLANLDPRRLKAGSSEIRNWIVIAAAAADLALDWSSYTPGYRTLALTGTGLAFASWK